MRRCRHDVKNPDAGLAFQAAPRSRADAGPEGPARASGCIRASRSAARMRPRSRRISTTPAPLQWAPSATSVPGGSRMRGERGDDADGAGDGILRAFVAGGDATDAVDLERPAGGGPMRQVADVGPVQRARLHRIIGESADRHGAGGKGRLVGIEVRAVAARTGQPDAGKCAMALHAFGHPGQLRDILVRPLMPRKTRGPVPPVLAHARPPSPRWCPGPGAQPLRRDSQRSRPFERRVFSWPTGRSMRTRSQDDLARVSRCSG